MLMQLIIKDDYNRSNRKYLRLNNIYANFLLKLYKSISVTIILVGECFDISWEACSPQARINLKRNSHLM